MTKNDENPDNDIPDHDDTAVTVPVAPPPDSAGAENAATDTAGQSAGAQATPMTAAQPTSFWKRKWVLITAPIVAGVLLLGIGTGAGYAIGEGGDRDGHHSQSESGRDGHTDQKDAKGQGESGSHHDGRGHGKSGRDTHGDDTTDGSKGSTDSKKSPRPTDSPKPTSPTDSPTGSADSDVSKG